MVSKNYAFIAVYPWTTNIFIGFKLNKRGIFSLFFYLFANDAVQVAQIFLLLK